MMKCREVATLLDMEQVGEASLWARIGVRMHLMMCQHCRRFARQIRQLRAGAQSMRSVIDSEASDAGLEEKIARTLGLSDRGPRK